MGVIECRAAMIFLGNKNNGFTLVELLVVLLIIGILSSVAVISINAARPSKSQQLFNKLKNQFQLSVDHAQLKNVSLQLFIQPLENKDDKEEDIYYQLKIQQFNSDSGKWNDHSGLMSKLPKWKNTQISNEQNIISILPNGFITPGIFELQAGEKSYQFDTTKLWESRKNQQVLL